MEKKTKIVVLRSRELIYTGVLIGLAILLVALIIVMVLGKKPSGQPAKETSGQYVAGVYKTSVTLNQTPIDVTVTVDSDHVNSIEFINLNETITTMYPLLQPSLENIARQVCEKQSTKDVTYPEESKYTSTLLLEAINESLEKAAK